MTFPTSTFRSFRSVIKILTGEIDPSMGGAAAEFEPDFGEQAMDVLRDTGLRWWAAGFYYPTIRFSEDQEMVAMDTFAWGELDWPY